MLGVKGGWALEKSNAIEDNLTGTTLRIFKGLKPSIRNIGESVDRQLRRYLCSSLKPQVEGGTFTAPVCKTVVSSLFSETMGWEMKGVEGLFLGCKYTGFENLKAVSTKPALQPFSA
ncbi:hypothetical protein AVEN_96433-1 [Araneus ventricosus]|uniref:Uncharacterized protein n=1 Tax=Araneus ventricosus TaxID=182803 RepID=A0A4Y2HY88_ARAVE|nr:hypothetical protein AVEN_96433-1 [Araneus ventricosus]